MSVTIAVVGSGYWGKNLVRNFADLGVLKTVCDSNKSMLKTVEASYPKVEFQPDYSRLLEMEELDAIVIATPAATHYRMAKAALEAGKDLFVEKPMALDVDQGEQLVALAEQNDRILMVGHVLHYHPAVIKLKEIVHSGELGEINYLYSNRVSIGKFRIEENILWSFAPHDISVILGLLREEPIRVLSQGGAYISENVADVTMSQFLFPSGVRAHIFVSWLHPFKEQRLVVVGSEKMAVFEDTAAQKLRLYSHRVEWKDRIPTAVKADPDVVKIASSEPLRNECEHFIDCIENRTQPLTDGNEGLRVLRILNQCQQALDSDRVNIS